MPAATNIEQGNQGGATLDSWILAAHLPLQQNLLGEMNRSENPMLLTPQALFDDMVNGRDRDLVILTTNIREMRSKIHRATSSAPKIDKILEEVQKHPSLRESLRPTWGSR